MSFDTFPQESDELVRRLRDLEWPAVQPDVRDRCWAAFKGELVGAEADDFDDLPTVESRRNVGRRFEFTRRALEVQRAGALGPLARPKWEIRPSRTLKTFVA